MIKYFAGPKYEDFNISNYDLSNLFDPPDDKVTYNYFCKNCEKSILYSTSNGNLKSKAYSVTNAIQKKKLH